MIVRKLRVFPASQKTAETGIDAVTDPVMLAHRLLRVDSSTERRGFDHRLRMSAMAKVCPRAQILAIRHNITVNETLSPGMRVTFDLGNAIHHFLQNGDGYLGESRIGWWRCLSCRRKTFGRKPLAKCPSCGASEKAAQYEEHALRVPEGHQVSGHIDGFLEVAPGDIRVIDFKTINGDDFESLAAPLPDHCMQVNGYMHYAQIDEVLPVRVNRESGLLLYVSKKHSFKTLPFKMFHVRRDEEMVKIITKKAEQFLQALKNEDYLPDGREVCAATKFSAAPARQCVVASFCKLHYEQGR